MDKVINIAKAVGYITGGSVVSVITEAFTHLSPLYIFLTVIAYLIIVILVTFILVRFERGSEIVKIKSEVLAEEDRNILNALNDICLNVKGTQKDICDKLTVYLEARINAFSDLEK